MYVELVVVHQVKFAAIKIVLLNVVMILVVQVSLVGVLQYRVIMAGLSAVVARITATKSNSF
jgi:hypothetical protein